MATSSIFHNVIIRTQKELEDFCKAIDECEKHPYVPPKEPLHMATKEDIERTINVWKERFKS